MKYKKGSIVEVLVNDNISNHSWRCAQIVSNNNDNYTVDYDVYPGFTNKSDMQQISIQSIRPCPPLLQVSESWIPGDVVEVFHNLSWKMAIVLKAYNCDQFLLRLVGSSQELQVTKFELRVKQSFQNGVWIVINKIQRDYKDAVDNNVTSSSDSCSINSNKPYEIHNGIEFEGCDSDAESVCQMRYEYDEEESNDDDDECVLMEDEVHRLELQAYRCTMEALHASGPLTWEKETMGQSSGFLHLLLLHQ